MNNIRLKNFRNIDDTGVISLRPLTILVGKNGMGKSSVMRLFPLLKQSVEVSKNGPLLWYSDKGVDFGDFGTVVKHGKNDIEIGFSINYGVSKEETFIINLTLTIVSAKQNTQPDGISYDYVKNLDIEFLGNKISILFENINEDKDMQNKAYVLINGNSCEEVNYEYFMSNIFPVIINNREEPTIPGFNELVSLLSENGKLRYRGPADFIGISFEEFKNKISGKEFGYNVKTIYEKIVFAYLPTLMLNIAMLVRFDADAVTYIGPFRDNPQRYYRFQNLSTNQIDMRGSNMAVFANAMPRNERSRFNEITKEHFGFELESESHSGHISINIKQNGQSTNIVDNGFGYSQVMPVLLALHAFTYTKPRVSYPFDMGGQMLCIEQPELHLHPAMQYQLGQAFADSVNYSDDNRMDKKILVETHSRSFIDAVGESVSDGKIKVEDVAVYIFEQGENGVIIRLSEFDEEGFLQDWPLGFLD